MGDVVTGGSGVGARQAEEEAGEYDGCLAQLRLVADMRTRMGLLENRVGMMVFLHVIRPRNLPVSHLF